jgi:hypothetical protein
MVGAKMTASELADELERPNNWQQENNFTTRAATMLRQQQERLTKYELRNIYQCDRIAILEAQLRKAQENG